MSIRVFGSMEINDSSPDIQLTIFVIKSAFPSDAKNSFEKAFPEPITTILCTLSSTFLSRAATIDIGPLMSSFF